MIDLTPSMTHALSTIGNRSVTAHEVGVNGGVLKRLAELGFLKIEMPREGFYPPIYALSEKGKGAAAILNAMPQPINREGPVARIQQRVAEHFRIPVNEMTSARRAIAVARPRQVAMYVAKQTTPKSLPHIGRLFGNRDHTTVIHAVRRVETLMSQDDDFAHKVKSLVAECAA